MITGNVIILYQVIFGKRCLVGFGDNQPAFKESFAPTRRVRLHLRDLHAALEMSWSSTTSLGQTRLDPGRTPANDYAKSIPARSMADLMIRLMIKNYFSWGSTTFSVLPTTCIKHKQINIWVFIVSYQIFNSKFSLIRTNELRQDFINNR